MQVTTATESRLNEQERKALEQEIALVLKSKKPKDFAMTQHSRLNEEDLYAAALMRKLTAADPGLAERFKTLFVEQVKLIQERQGRTRIFAAADRVMRAFVRSSAVSRELYRESRAFAFGKAQLDSDRTWLSLKKVEGTKNGDTPVRAVATALQKYELNEAATEAEFGAYRSRVEKESAAKWRAQHAAAASETALGTEEEAGTQMLQ